ncbi:hypothetical protein F480_04270 [Bibersteinia trehalosi Y31]|uniref:Uncharacterized protein n=1 Tax=Bibersteinia trehalosi Y31 TaxID=1261658 RepID=A0A179D0Z5_BIBTR|nr:hypothetical protein [Bibersteinia trehalosi]OAQ15835.1 hypothetical protein F480_04270 [Bibersteinia trehalosi Y31]
MRLFANHKIITPCGFEIDYKTFENKIVKFTHYKYEDVWFEIKIDDPTKNDFIIGFVIKNKHLLASDKIRNELKNTVSLHEEMNYHENKVIYISTPKLEENEIVSTLNVFSKIILDSPSFLDK